MIMHLMEQFINPSKNKHYQLFEENFILIILVSLKYMLLLAISRKC